MEKILEKLKKKENLNFEESKSVFETIMSGQAKDDQIYDFLTLLSDKGESPEEIAAITEPEIKTSFLAHGVLIKN